MDSTTLQRASGSLDLIFFRADDAVTRLKKGRQAGCLRVRFPNREPDGALEGVTLNMAGGLADGDVLTVSVLCEPGAAARLTSAAAEKVYKARGEQAADAAVKITLEAGASFEWMPQETILFNESRLRRSLDVEMDAAASLLIVEAVILGRTAMGERVRTGSLIESWRVRRGGRLIFAEALRLDGPVEGIAARPAVLDGAAAFATVLLIAPGAEARLDDVRAALDKNEAEAGASAWDGRLVARLAARDGAALRKSLSDALSAARGRPVPRVWTF